MKCLTVAIPCYNSQNEMRQAIDPLLAGGEAVEVLIVDDGSTDSTGKIADEYQAKYPAIVTAIHQPNGGHGNAVMTGLHHARGRFFKVLDSDDRFDPEAYASLLKTLSSFGSEAPDLLVTNYCYDKQGSSHPHVTRYRNVLPGGRIFGWEETGRFRNGQYILMHAATFRTDFLRSCDLNLPDHTFYVDDLYVYAPLSRVRRLYYLDVDLYMYRIGREGQSVQESVMIQRIDQKLLVNRLMILKADPFASSDPKQRRYMLQFLEIVTSATSTMLIKSGTRENLRKKEELWDFLRDRNPRAYAFLRRRPMGILLHLPGRAGRRFVVQSYGVVRRHYGFN